MLKEIHKSTFILTFSFTDLEAQKSHPKVALALALLPGNSRDYYGPFVLNRLIGVINFVKSTGTLLVGFLFLEIYLYV